MSAPVTTANATLPTAESGLTTTEFWVTQAAAFLAQVIVLLSVFGVIHWNDDQKAAVMAFFQTCVILAEGFYAVSRGIRKAGTQG